MRYYGISLWFYLYIGDGGVMLYISTKVDESFTMLKVMQIEVVT